MGLLKAMLKLEKANAKGPRKAKKTQCSMRTAYNQGGKPRTIFQKMYTLVYNKLGLADRTVKNEKNLPAKGTKITKREQVDFIEEFFPSIFEKRVGHI